MKCVQGANRFQSHQASNEQTTAFRVQPLQLFLLKIIFNVMLINEILFWCFSTTTLNKKSVAMTHFNANINPNLKLFGVPCTEVGD